jgi:hypothetical protein
MKKIINAKLEEAKQFNNKILENIKEAIPISKTFLANTKKAINSFKQSKKSFSNVQNSSNETKISIDEFIKANNDYNANPTEKNIKLINQKRSALLYNINLNSNNAKIFSSDVLILENNMFKNIETMKEFLPTLKDVKVNINKLNLTYLKINQLIKIKKTIKNLNNHKPKQITRPIFGEDQTTPSPRCEELRKLIIEGESRVKILTKTLKEFWESGDGWKTLKLLAPAEEELKLFQKEMADVQLIDPNHDQIVAYQKEIEKIKTWIKRFNVRNLISTAGFNYKNNQIITLVSGSEIMDAKTEKEIKNLQIDKDSKLRDIKESLEHQAQFGIGPVALANAQEQLATLEKLMPTYFFGEKTIKLVASIAKDISNATSEISSIEYYLQDLRVRFNISKKYLEELKSNVMSFKELRESLNCPPIDVP